MAKPSASPSNPWLPPARVCTSWLNREFLPSDHALMVPKTADGRALFAVPWLGKVILGTTDSPRQDVVREPLPFKEEVAFILNESARYLSRAPKQEDIRSIWVGLRPLVKPQDEDGGNTKQHQPRTHRAGQPQWPGHRDGGGMDAPTAPWRKTCCKSASTRGLPPKAAGITNQLPLVGSPWGAVQHSISDAPGIHLYGAEPPQRRPCQVAPRSWVGLDGSHGALCRAV